MLTRLIGVVPEFVTVEVLVRLELPRVTFPIERLEGVKVMPRAAPVPEIAKVWVPALSVSVTVPLIGPVVPGLKITLMTQLFAGEGANVVLQEFVWVKPELAPMPDRVMGAPLVLVTTTFKGLLGTPTGCGLKVSVAGCMTTGSGTPFPVSFTICGLPGTLSLSCKAPLTGPATVGLNRTETVQA